jgi:translation initiation factor 2 beta subunit (eIF-2beta)/eIF-5
VTADSSEREIDYLICKECQTPCYVFETETGRILEAQCAVCGNEEPLHFAIGEVEEE